MDLCANITASKSPFVMVAIPPWKEVPYTCSGQRPSRKPGRHCQRTRRQGGQRSCQDHTNPADRETFTKAAKLITKLVNLQLDLRIDARITRRADGKDRVDDREAQPNASTCKSADIGQAVQARDRANKVEEQAPASGHSQPNSDVGVPTTRPRREPFDHQSASATKKDRDREGDPTAAEPQVGTTL